MYNYELPETEMKWILYGACVVKTNFVEEEYNTKKKRIKNKSINKKKQNTLVVFARVLNCIYFKEITPIVLSLKIHILCSHRVLKYCVATPIDDDLNKKLTNWGKLFLCKLKLIMKTKKKLRFTAKTWSKNVANEARKYRKTKWKSNTQWNGKLLRKKRKNMLTWQ